MRITPLKVAFFFLLVAVILWIYGYPQAGGCVVTYQNYTIRGNSLEGFMNEGDEVRVAQGYYRCSAPARGDVVIYNDAGNAEPVIKMVRGIGGDTFVLALSEGGAKIVLNGQILKTSTGEPYRLSEDAFNLLSMYESDYNGVIPDGAVFLLGNIAGGSRDSTQFGFVSVSDLPGKVTEVRAATL